MFGQAVDAEIRLGDDSFSPLIEALLLFEAKYLGEGATGSESQLGKVNQWSILPGEWDHKTKRYQPSKTYNLLTWSILKMGERTLCRLLKLAVPAVVSEPSPGGQTPMEVAEWYGREDVIKVLKEDCKMEQQKPTSSATNVRT
ncbi:uncharacterized protein B0I36DRAFT_326644 [Microdochium trichocladiopsis]|uniref:Ankyrin repeat-containing domain protein n=1 Tax=Microdochium trichocladiopsis TaxID=1682393 RepID=A0A9P8Y2D3_9PEZI|nr:uncharacterized protein B0I36DRAFT_326644 [Microdochium trichocladiopsis]KAH7027194.1 hypothetical protein B0I36DRAFT_326644 [Microdochium trichocladiopsis]